MMTIAMMDFMMIYEDLTFYVNSNEDRDGEVTVLSVGDHVFDKKNLDYSNDVVDGLIYN